MWVYQEQETENKPAVIPMEEIPFVFSADIENSKGGKHHSREGRNAPVEGLPNTVTERKDKRQRGEKPHIATAGRKESGTTSRVGREALWMIAVYLIGMLSAGMLLTGCGEREKQLLLCYMEQMQKNLLLTDGTAVVSLFRLEYLSAMGLLTVILLLGMSVFGAFLIYLSVILYGAGSGLILIELFLYSSWKERLVWCGGTALFSSLLGVCICTLATAAVQTSVCIRGLLNVGEGERGSEPQEWTARFVLQRLLKKYLLLGIALLPLVGIFVGLLNLALHWM